MKGTSLATMAWRNLWRNRRRTYITLSAIVFGVFLAVIMMAMQDRNWADMIRLAARLGAGHVTIQHPEYLDTPTLTRTVQGTDALRRLAEDDPHVIRVVERITGFAMLATARENVGAGFIAVSPGAGGRRDAVAPRGDRRGRVLRLVDRRRDHSGREAPPRTWTSSSDRSWSTR